MTGRRRLWRWGVVAWVIVVAVAGAATLWLQDSAEPPGPYSWQEASPSATLPEGWESACADATPDENGQKLCFIRTR
ncbi:hypothetical protein [Streptomyces sp. HD]|uniref:hypothetical protein n=1 Tax=Streptomyces sp. HD TaxID=3020892 RepID=UPI00232E9D3D|nr:hypothetical protein [Streptomyces sp. HD]MDC0768087.1 hypothetical protein [Streptomyces sp. HD]